MFKIIGLVIGVAALLWILKKQTANEQNKWIYPISVFFGFGIIDILFKQIALYTVLPYTTSLFIVFVIALIIALAIVLYEVILKKENLNVKNILLEV